MEVISEEDKKAIIQSMNQKIGGDINDLSNAYVIESELAHRKDILQSRLQASKNEVPTKLTAAIIKAELNSTRVADLKRKSADFKGKVDDFLDRTNTMKIALDSRFGAIAKLEQAVVYLESFEEIEDLNQQLKKCNDDEQAVVLYGQLKKMCVKYENGHRAAYYKEYTHFWHNVLKDKFAKNYDDILKQLKWPFTSGAEQSPPKELLLKFINITRFLFLIQEPEDLLSSSLTEDFSEGQDPSLPIRILLRPLKKRFTFHFTGPRQTARIDRPEWFLTQTLTWIKDHQEFVRTHVQPVADKLQMKNVRVVDEFNGGLIAFAAERLHTVLGLYVAQSAKGEVVDVDAAFAHAVDETLGFHRELVALTGREVNGVLSVLTKAETFVRWLAVEKKYALSKLDETLSNDQWCDPVAAGVGAATGSMLWVPRGADWFIAVLKTIEDRYAALPQPGHRLEFLELQLELIEEWRVRLTQLMNAAIAAIDGDSLLHADSFKRLTAVVNAAYHTRTVLLQWTHSLHYLQLYFYRRQFLNFTHKQHRGDNAFEHFEPGIDVENITILDEYADVPLSFEDIETRAKDLAQNLISKREPLVITLEVVNDDSEIPEFREIEEEGAAEETGVFSEAPDLLARLRDAGVTALADRILLEFKASLREYKKQKWHAMLVVEEIALSVSPALCQPLSRLCARLSSASECLAPQLAKRLRTRLAIDLDEYVFAEVVLQSWFNTGGTIQLSHDVKRNLVPAFAPPGDTSHIDQLPKLLGACKLLNLDYDDARRLRAVLSKDESAGYYQLKFHHIRYVEPSEALQILNQRTDLNESSSPSNVMELF